MSRIRRFGGHEAVICIFQSLREYQHIAQGFFLFSLVFGFNTRQIFACAWLRGIAGPKKRLSTLY